jgi:hypothetical protein
MSHSDLRTINDKRRTMDGFGPWKVVQPIMDLTKEEGIPLGPTEELEFDHRLNQRRLSIAAAGSRIRHHANILALRGRAGKLGTTKVV